MEENNKSDKDLEIYHKLVNFTESVIESNIDFEYIFLSHAYLSSLKNILTFDAPEDLSKINDLFICGKIYKIVLIDEKYIRAILMNFFKDGEYDFEPMFFCQSREIFLNHDSMLEQKEIVFNMVFLNKKTNEPIYFNILFDKFGEFRLSKL